MCVHNSICMHTPTCSRVEGVQWFWRCIPIAPTCSLVYGSVVFCISQSRRLQLPPPPFCRYLSAPMQQARHDSQASGWCQVLIWAMTTKALLCVELSGAILIGFPLYIYSHVNWYTSTVGVCECVECHYR